MHKTSSHRGLPAAITVLLLGMGTLFPTFVTNAQPSLLAQAESCRRVIAPEGATIHQSPAVDSSVLGTVSSRRSLTIQNLGGNGWVPITAPLQGYVLSTHLGLCEQASAPPPNTCRRVVAAQGLNVRRSPSSSGQEISYISPGRRVIITNDGFNGWVPITMPVQGYVSASGLGYCRWSG